MVEKRLLNTPRVFLNWENETSFEKETSAVELAKGILSFSTVNPVR